MVTMAQSAENWRNTTTHMDRTHSLTTFASSQLQPRGTKRQLSYYFSVRVWSFLVSVIHRTLTWTTGYLACVRDHPCACVYSRGGWAHGRVSTTFLTRKNSPLFLMLLIIVLQPHVLLMPVCMGRYCIRHIYDSVSACCILHNKISNVMKRVVFFSGSVSG